MNKIRSNISRLRFILISALLVALAAIALLVRLTVSDAGERTDRITFAQQRRIDKLDACARELMAADLRLGWPEIKGLSDDMVLYRYDAKTLSCWYNVFPVQPIVSVSQTPVRVCLGQTWYFLKNMSEGAVTVLEGLRIDDDDDDIELKSTASLLFSPVLYKGKWFIHSFGALLIFNFAIFLVILYLFIFRSRIAASCARKRSSVIGYTAFLCIAAAGVLVYTVLSVKDLTSNSNITLTIERIERGPLFTALAFFSYSTLMLTVLMLCECWASLNTKVTGRPRTFLSYKNILLFALSGAMLLDAVTLTENFKREESRVLSWSNSLVSRADAARIQPYYSFAKYYNDRLLVFHGTYSYPTILDKKIHTLIDGRRSVVLDGYRHFINVLNDKETVIVSRSRVGVASCFVSFSYLACLLLLLALAVRGRTPKEERPDFFSTRMRRLVVWSLVISLITMTTISALFVYQRTLANRYNLMVDRIGAIQMMAGNLCRNVSANGNIYTPAFANAIQEIAANTESVINVYSVDGRLCISSVKDRYDLAPTRLDSDAYQEIVLWHQLHFIKEQKVRGKDRYVMFAPVFNRYGNCVAILSVPYSDRNDNFMRDAVFHSSTMLGLFMILLIVAMVFATSITNQIFRPLVLMGQKMKGRSAEDLELIEYSGDDEISDLVAAYNNMVMDLRDSSVRLAASERDKAWSEMARQVAHEIKNPLTPMKLDIQRLIRLKQKDDPRWVAMFDEISSVVLEHIDILGQTASQFSDFAKLYSENPVVIDLDKTVRDQILLFGESCAGITYLGMEGALTFGPRPQLVRVFVNLLTNAVQALSEVEDAQILVSLRRGRTGMLDVVFEDNGPGVSEEDRERIFRPNFTTKSSGTGLGLAISRNIVECCGGTIVCSRSFTLGGACFTVSLPEYVETNV